MEADNCKIFIGGISWDTNQKRLREYFRAYGKVVESVIIKDRTTRRARGFGFVAFSDPAVAEEVLKKKHKIDGKMVDVKKAAPKNGSPGPYRSTKIFVGGLASTVTESDFKKYFDQFGTIKDLVVMCDPNTQRPRGFGFITYDSEEAVDSVFLRSFHELNGKMVEVKRAVPKKLSPGPNHSPLGVYNYGLSGVNSFLNGFTQGYCPSNVGGYGLPVDGRVSPVARGRIGFPLFGSGYGMSANFEPGFNPEFRGNANFYSDLSVSRGLNPDYFDSSKTFGSYIGYDCGNGRSNSFFSPGTQNLWVGGGLSYGTSSPNSIAHIGLGGGRVKGNTISNAEVDVSLSNDHLGSRGANNNYSLGIGGYRRRSYADIPLTSSYSAPNGGFDGTFSEFYGSSSVYDDPIYRSSNFEQDGFDPFGYGLGVVASDISAKSSPGYVGSYTVNKRQPNKGIAT